MKDRFTLTSQQQTLVENHLHLVHWTIHRYIGTDETVLGLGYEDLYQEGAIGLCRAAATFASTSAVQFSTFAVTVIRNHLLDYCRTVQASRKNLPVVSMDAYEEVAQPLAAVGDDMDALISDLAAAELLDRFKRRYHGVARLGIEALEYKVKGYSGADIARMYHTKPNYIGACIARAAEMLQREREVMAFYFACVEKPTHHS